MHLSEIHWIHDIYEKLSKVNSVHVSYAIKDETGKEESIFINDYIFRKTAEALDYLKQFLENQNKELAFLILTNFNMRTDPDLTDKLELLLRGLDPNSIYQSKQILEFLHITSSIFPPNKQELKNLKIIIDKFYKLKLHSNNTQNT